MYKTKAFSLKKKKKKNFKACSGNVQGECCWEKLVAGHSQGLTMAYTMELFLLLVGGISCG